jgi:hypothetical protein
MPDNATLQAANLDADRFTVENFEIWGRLVATWATGIDHVNDGNQHPRPTTIAELRAQLQQLKTAFNLPARYTNLIIDQSDGRQLVIWLPEKQLLLEGEQEVTQPGAPYRLPQFYKDKFRAVDLDPQTPPDQKLSILMMRVGDYSMNNCR